MTPLSYSNMSDQMLQLNHIAKDPVVAYVRG